MKHLTDKELKREDYIKMPYKFETDKTKLPRVKLTDQQRDEIAANVDNLSQRKLASKYGVSRRLIQFILNPEKMRENLQRRQERGGSSIYYNKEKHTEHVREHRRHKAAVLSPKHCKRCKHYYSGQDDCPVCNGLKGDKVHVSV